MSSIPAPLEIPLLRESAAFVSRLVAAARAHGDSRWRLHRRINWSHRYGHAFYAAESERFSADGDGYLAGRVPPPAPLEDVFRQRLSWKELAAVTLKVLAHRTFAVIGRRRWRQLGALGPRAFRKCYVDDIELVFDPAEPGVMRAVYPFPLSVRRQWRYLKSIRSRGIAFAFAGHAYGWGDWLRLAWRRDRESLARLEARSQIVHAREVAALGVGTVQVSDEFNLGSLEFSRTLARLGVHVVNSAHGVGKYLPAHAYREFWVLTRKQQQYYVPLIDCRYALRTLNDQQGGTGATTRTEPDGQAHAHIVLLSQCFPGLTPLVGVNEAAIIERLASAFGSRADMTLYFKPHPTQGECPPPPGFVTLPSLAHVNSRPGTVFISQYSTCQIDPSFKGRKLLVRRGLIHPEICFDDEDNILSLDELVQTLQAWFPTAARRLAPQERVA
ncbi:MAG: hypothetical protein ACK51Z_15970 [Pseudomonadota bacterium]